MNRIKIIPPNQSLCSEVEIPGSKSYTNRALIMASLSDKPVTIDQPLYSDDTEAMIKCLIKLGIRIIAKKEKIIVGGSNHDVKDRYYELDAGLSGTTIRFILAMSTVLPGTKKIFGKKSLNERPIKELVSVLKQLGAEIDYLEKEGFAPLIVRSSKLKPGIVKMRGDISSQYFSAVLIVAPLIGQVTIDVLGKQISRPYIDMTIDIMQKFGVSVDNIGYRRYQVRGGQRYQIKVYCVEGDFSSAGYFFALAALTGSVLKIINLNRQSKQADFQFIKILEKMGNEITYGTNFIIIKGRGVKPLNINMESCPDQAQTMAVLAAFADGKTVIRGIRSLRIKETERIKALEQELAKMGIKTESDPNSLTIYGGNPISARIDTYNDHRMAMSFAVAGTKIAGMVINHPEVVSKTFPSFWKKLESIGVKIVMS